MKGMSVAVKPSAMKSPTVKSAGMAAAVEAATPHESLRHVRHRRHVLRHHRVHHRHERRGPDLQMMPPRSL